MSGHSKWSQIKHKKGVSDQKKGQVFGKLAKKIAMVAKDNPNPDSNFKLKAVIDEARGFNMPKDNIERAIKRASEKGSAELKEFAVSAMGSAGVGIIIRGITDNTNRSISEIRNILNKNDIKVVPEGSLGWMFDHEMKPVAPVELPDQALADKFDKVLEELDDHNDVENIYSTVASD